MSCYHPIFAIVNPYVKSVNGKDKLLFLKGDQIEKVLKGKKYNEKLSYLGQEVLQLPCGKCIGCKLDYSRMWATRCYCELKYTKNNWFLTLTYDDEHLPMVDFVDKINKHTGEVLTRVTPQLVKRDLQNFNKRLRQQLVRDSEKEPERYNLENFPYRFYACGEYGTQKLRPHFHVIAFNLPLFDLKSCGSSGKGHLLWRSDWLDRVWGNGIVKIGIVSFESVAYTARYCLSKVDRDDNWYRRHGLCKEFTLMSRRPAIGRKYFDDNFIKIYDNDCVYTNSNGNVFTQSVPKYFDRVLENLDEDLFEGIKKGRKDKFRPAPDTDKMFRDYLATQELIKKSKIKCLTRSI